MDDLVQKYFREDLAEAEENALLDALAHSEEQALRLRDLAEERYRSYGLPAPQWPGGDDPPRAPGPGRKPWIGPLLLSGLALFLLTLAYGVYKLVPSPDAVQGGGAAIPPDQVPSHGRKDAPSPPQAPDQEPRGTDPSPTSNGTLAPINMDEDPERRYSNLAVVVRRHAPGKVAVRVLDQQGKQVLMLFDGTLRTGKWVFDWDGRLGDGTPLSAGFYQVQVESGPVTQRKSISIRQKPAE